jgi:rare lipoprotein A
MKLFGFRHCSTWALAILLTGCVSAPPSDHAEQGPAISSASAPAAQPGIGDLFSGQGENHGATSDHSLANASPLTPPPDISSFHQVGRASWYGGKFFGRRTASGERYDIHALTAAHRSLPMASYVRVTNQSTGKSIVVRINDRGPFRSKRVIDLSLAAASELDLQHSGTAVVEIQGLSSAEARAAREGTLAAGQ